jgi:hypothetical protein
MRVSGQSRISLALIRATLAVRGAGGLDEGEVSRVWKLTR